MQTVIAHKDTNHAANSDSNVKRGIFIFLIYQSSFSTYLMVARWKRGLESEKANFKFQMFRCVDGSPAVCLTAVALQI